MNENISKELYFFGHHKCATNWIRRLFRDLCTIKKWNYRVYKGRGKNLTFPRSDCYVYMYVNANSNCVTKMTSNSRGFHLIRDPRDALVSQYWSWKNVHQNNNEMILNTRKKLQKLNIEDGLIEILDVFVMLQQLRDWSFNRYKNILEVKYENLVENPYSQFQNIFNYLQIDISDQDFQDLVDRNSFQKITNRIPGEEDYNSHFRKGIAGDWKNYFTERVKYVFKERYGNELIRLGYEKNLDW